MTKESESPEKELVVPKPTKRGRPAGRKRMTRTRPMPKLRRKDCTRPKPEPKPEPIVEKSPLRDRPQTQQMYDVYFDEIFTHQKNLTDVLVIVDDIIDAVEAEVYELRSKKLKGFLDYLIESKRRFIIDETDFEYWIDSATTGSRRTVRIVRNGKYKKSAEETIQKTIGEMKRLHNLN